MAAMEIFASANIMFVWLENVSLPFYGKFCGGLLP